MTVLIAGSHGFIGYSLAKRLLDAGHEVLGVDKMKAAISEKGPRVRALEKYSKYRFVDLDLADKGATHDLFAREKFEHAAFLAGQYSQPYSEQHVENCMRGNVIAVNNFFEAAARKKLRRVLYASSTFVQDGVRPVTMYGATKEWAELCASVYSAQFGMETIGFRFGSVYGPHVRPDVGIAYTARMLWKNGAIDVTKGGYTYKVAFVYIDDVVECLVRALELPARERYQVLTLVAEDEVRDMVQVLDFMEKHTGKRAKRLGQRAPEQPAKIPFEQCARTREALGYAPSTKMDDGIREFCKWYEASRVLG